MSSSNFELSLKYVLQDEGGNDDDPHDHGGRTSRGITQREFDAWCSLNGASGGDVWEATTDQIRAIYKTQYWDPYCDSLPNGLDYVFFDTAVNAGRSQAIRSLQKALGVNDDGMMGQITLSAVKNHTDIAKLIHDMSEVRRNFYRHLAQFPRYGKGWLRRVDHCERGALIMIPTDTYVAPQPILASYKADENDVATMTVAPETSGVVTVGAGGILQTLGTFKDSLSAYADSIEYIKYVLIGIAVISLVYSAYGFIHRSKVQAAV